MEFEINFLEKKRSAAWVDFFHRFRPLILAAVLGISLVLLVGLYSKAITHKTSQAVASGQKLLKVTMEKEKVAGLGNLLNRLENEKMNWTGKLISLSRATPDQVYLTSLELEKKSAQPGGKGKEGDRLVLKGVIVAGGGEDPSAIIQDFLNNLRNSPQFMQGFEPPVLVSVSDARRERCSLCLDFEFYLSRRGEES